MTNSFEGTYSKSKIFKFAYPSILMMMCFSFYTIIDGMFISRYVGTDALGATNIVYPIICLSLGLSIMIASGGSAIISKLMGEGDYNKARKSFSFLVLSEILISLILMSIILLFMDQFINLLGATEIQFDFAKDYLTIMISFIPFYFLQSAFQTFFITSGHPKIGLSVTIIAGLLNVILDYLFIVIFDLGIKGAAMGTVTAWMIPSLTGLIYFFFKRNGSLYFVKCKIDFKLLLSTCINGSSEMITNLANAITTFLFNYVCLKYFKEDGVAAITIVLYFQFLFTAIFFGFSQGVSPLISFKYGAKSEKEVKDITRFSIISVLICGVICFLISLGLIYPIAQLFANNEENVYNIVTDNFIYYAFAFIFMGFSIFTSAFFTALNNGKVSAMVSFLRTIVFLSTSILVVPLIFKGRGVFLATTVAEFLSFTVSIICFLKYKKVYKY